MVATLDVLTETDGPVKTADLVGEALQRAGRDERRNETVEASRCRQTCTYLKAAGLATNPQRGVWEATEKGRAIPDGEDARVDAVRDARNAYGRAVNARQRAAKKTAAAAREPVSQQAKRAADVPLLETLRSHERWLRREAREAEMRAEFLEHKAARVQREAQDAKGKAAARRAAYEELREALLPYR